MQIWKKNRGRWVKRKTHPLISVKTDGLISFISRLAERSNSCRPCWIVFDRKEMAYLSLMSQVLIEHKGDNMSAAKNLLDLLLRLFHFAETDVLCLTKESRNFLSVRLA